MHLSILPNTKHQHFLSLLKKRDRDLAERDNLTSVTAGEGEQLIFNPGTEHKTLTFPQTTDRW